MSTAEYLATFISIVIGLAFADLLTSMHRLIRARKRVHWDWLPIVAWMLVVLLIVQRWWRDFAFLTAQSSFVLGNFLPDLLSLSILFFLASAALPDEVPERGLDLRSYYLENRSYFWGLLASYALVSTVMILLGRPDSVPRHQVVTTAVINSFMIASMIVLIFTSRRWVHGLVVLVQAIFLVSVWVRLSVGG